MRLEPLDERIDRECQEQRDEEPDEDLPRDRGEVDQLPHEDHQTEHGEDRANAEPDDPLDLGRIERLVWRRFRRDHRLQASRNTAIFGAACSRKLSRRPSDA